MLQLFFLISIMIISVSALVFIKKNIKDKQEIVNTSNSDPIERKIIIQGENYRLEFPVSFYDNNTAKSVLNNLPINGKINKWAEGLYFSAHIEDLETFDETSDLEIGEIAYWPENKAISIFYGPTFSDQNETVIPKFTSIKIGKTVSKVELLKKIAIGDRIEIE